jgi:hypothetical protein
VGLFDKLALFGKAKKLAEEHADKVSAAIDKVADVVDDKTGGKYADKIDKGAKAAKGFIDADDTQTPVDGNPAAPSPTPQAAPAAPAAQAAPAESPPPPPVAQ